MSPRAKRRLFSLVTVAGTVSLVLLVAEAALRIWGYTPIYVNPLRSFHCPVPELGYRGRPSFSGRFQRAGFDVVIVHDELGFRKQERQHPEETSAYRLFCFGDSTTWGWGVPQGEEYTDRLSDLLPDAHVVNRGMNGTGTFYQWLLFQREAAARVRPGDVVFLQFSHNDFSDNVNDDGDEPRGRVVGDQVVAEPAARTLEPSLKDRLKDWSCLWNLGTYGFDSLRRRVTLNLETRKGAGLDERLDDERVRVTRFALAGFARSARERGARFLVARTPGKNELDDARANKVSLEHDRGFQRALEAICAAEGIEAVDLMPALRRDAAAGERGRALFLRGDGHWNSEGHRLAALAIAARVRELRGRLP